MKGTTEMETWQRLKTKKERRDVQKAARRKRKNRNESKSEN